MASPGLKEIQKLLAIINTEGAKVIETCARRDLDFGPLNEPFDSGRETALRNGQVKLSVDLLIAAASHLTAALQDPRVTMAIKSQSWEIPTCMRIVTELNVPEILDEAGPDGMHARDIAVKANVDAGKLARILRLLATDHYFREVAPDVFAHNKRSSILSTSKPSAEVIANPETKHEGSSGIPALLSMLGGRNMVVGCHLLENLTDPKTAFSEEQEHSTFVRVMGTPLFEWFSDPKNAKARRNFGIAMTGSVGFQPPTRLGEAFDWASLPPASLVVDVGGGVGSATFEVAQAYPHLNFVVQDLPSVVVEGEKWFKARLPLDIEGGRVKFEAHNFFEPQPTRPAPPRVFFLRLITHDWSAKYLVKILTNLRNAAGPETRLLVQDMILANACPAFDEDLPEQRGLEVFQPPSPLLSNLGSIMPYQADLGMMNSLNSQERTLSEFRDVFNTCKWKFEYIYRFERIGTGLIVSSPA